ncbi:MAG TPA: GGDEF domain-containing protein [Deltaproteobacteria bacterium]|nr:GGDEF domain-containing protein [Deltaproteobacteria bacterium]
MLFQIIPQDDPLQALRLRRFFMAMAMYAFCAFLVYLSCLANIMDWRAIFVFLVGIPLINLTLYIVFRTGLNLRFTDPSLTSLQLSIGIVVTTYAMYYANEARGVLLLIYILVFIFGIFRLNTRQFLYISAFCLLTYGTNIILMHIFRPDKVNFHIEYLQWGVLSLVLVAFSVMAGYISALRQKLSTSRAELEKSFSIIREMAIRDDLTGFYNRRHLSELIEYERNRCSRGGSVFCLAMLDIDHFKNINDMYGHQAGDQTLKTFAAIIRETLRSTDFCGRYGGEEFLIVLTQTNIDGAKVFAERLRRLIEKKVFPELGDDIIITASLGLTQYQPKEDVEKTIHRADTALYEAKKKGRNRVECCA